MAADRDLLFGLLALQNGLIDQSGLVAAFRAWTRDRSRPLAEHLADRGDLDADQRPVVEAMVGLHLKKHGGDAERSLASIPAGRSTRDRLEALGDPDLTATVAHLGSGSTEPGDDRTITYTVGAASADGLRFRVLRPHARGGLGAVFVALDGELNREVALKQILEHHADDAVSRLRFLLEAEITGGLEHPGIVPVYGLGAYKDGRPYYAMRFVRGDSLKEAIKAFHKDAALRADPGRRSLALRKLLRRFTDVCNAIDYAHSRGVLHRDIKPGNVIVGKHGETLVVDWGLAKPTGRSGPAADPAERTLMPASAAGGAETLPGSALGTPAYISPEQARGDPEALGPRSDVYSLGATLYCLLTGRAPFEGDDPGATLRAVQRGEFPPPRAADPTIDPALEAVCLKAMATDPAARYGSARALAEDVERWAADEPVSAYREPAARRARRWARRHRTLVSAAAATLLVSLAGLGLVLAVQGQANAALATKNQDLDIANRELREAIEQKDAANAALADARDEVQARFDLARDAIRSFKGAVEQEEALKEDRLQPLRDKLLGSARQFYDKLGTLLEGRPDAASRAVLAESYAELGGLIDRIGQLPESKEAYRKAVALRRDLVARPGAAPADRVALAEALNGLGDVNRRLGDPAEALAAHEEAAALVEPLAAGPGATFEARRALGFAHHGAGQALIATNEVQRALGAHRLAVAVREALASDPAAVPDDQVRLADSIGSLGLALEANGDRGGALDELRRSRDRLRALAERHPAVPDYRRRLAISHNRVGVLLKANGDRGGALDEQREYYRLMRELVERYPAVSQYRRGLGGGHVWIGELLDASNDLDGALAEYRRAQEIFRDLTERYPDFLEYRFNLAFIANWIGDLLERTGDMTGALAEQREYRRLMGELAERHPDVPENRRELAIGHTRVGFLLEMSGDTAGALDGQREYQRLMRDLAERYPTDSDYRSQLALGHLRVGVLLTTAGRAADALAELEQARTLLEAPALPGTDVPDSRTTLARVLCSAGDALRDLGRTEEARDRADRAVALADELATAIPDVPARRSRLADGLRRRARLGLDAGDAAGADADARRAVALFEGLPSLNASEAFWLACARATLAAVGREGPEASSAEADRAVDDLRRAVAMGNRNLPGYRREPALDPLRDRDDFRVLMMDQAFPADAFAP